LAFAVDPRPEKPHAITGCHQIAKKSARQSRQDSIGRVTAHSLMPQTRRNSADARYNKVWFEMAQLPVFETPGLFCVTLLKEMRQPTRGIL